MNGRPQAFLVSLILFAGAAAPAAGQERGKAFTPGFGKEKSSPVERVKPCEAHGAGFRAMTGNSSCIRVFGGVRMEGSATRSIR